MVKLQTGKTKKFIFIISIFVVITAGILFLFVKVSNDSYIVNRLYPMVGENKQVVMDKLYLKNANAEKIGIEEYYSTNIDNRNISVIFTNGLCSGYSVTFKDAKTTTDELKTVFNKFNKLYGTKDSTIVLPDNRINSILYENDGLKTIKDGDAYLQEWKLPVDTEKEKIILGNDINSFYGLNIRADLKKQGEDYIVRIWYTANRNK